MRATSNKIIVAEHIVRAYRLGGEELRALDDVSLTIAEGELVAIMGASGSGKSTLLNVLGCLDRPTSGSYWLDGREVSNLSRSELAEVRNRTLGFVFQSFNLLARTTAVENVELPLIYAGVPRKERRARAIAALQRVGLGTRLEHRPAELSGGQQQRVALARALVNEPRIILADEPTGNLDSKTGVDVMALLQALWKQGMTIVFVTHDADVAQFASRVVLIKDARVVSDTPQEPITAKPPEAKAA